tara:strand:+ start:902 stop:1264 length:363 start_codon:yes stop_codon:yes gene_type:complete
MDMNNNESSEFDFDDDEFDFINPDEIEVSRRGAEKKFDQGLLHALQRAAETGEALRVKSMRVDRDEFASKAEFANEKQKASQEIRKHFDELKTQEVISESASLKLNWAQSSGIPQAIIRD